VADVHSWYDVGVTCLSGFLFGCEMCVITLAGAPAAAGLGLSTGEKQFAVASIFVGTAAGSAAAGLVSARLGNTGGLLATAIAFAVASALMAGATGLAALVAGRMVGGAAIGVSAALAPLALERVCGPASRGFVISVNELALCTGCLLMLAACSPLVPVTDGWRVMFALLAIPAVVQAVALVGRLRRERRAHAAAPSPPCESPLMAPPPHAPPPLTTACAVLRDGTARLQLVAGAAACVAQNLCASNALLYYAYDIMGAVGDRTPVASAVGVGAVKLAGVLIGVVAIRSARRRTVLMVGSAVEVVSLATIAAAFAGVGGAPAPPLARAALLAFMRGGNASGAPVILVLAPAGGRAAPRPRGGGGAWRLSGAPGAATNGVFLSALAALGGTTLFTILAAGAALEAAVAVALPETKDVALADIPRAFHAAPLCRLLACRHRRHQPLLAADADAEPSSPPPSTTVLTMPTS